MRREAWPGPTLASARCDRGLSRGASSRRSSETGLAVDLALCWRLFGQCIVDGFDERFTLDRPVHDMRMLLFRRVQFGLRGLEGDGKDDRRVHDRRSRDCGATVGDIEKEQIPSAAI